MNCKYCGLQFEAKDLHFNETMNARLLKEETCADCDFWKRILEDEMPNDIHYWFVHEGQVYHDLGDGKTNAGQKGHGGARFYIETADGRCHTTDNLWCRGRVSETWRSKFPDDCKFIDANTFRIRTSQKHLVRVGIVLTFPVEGAWGGILKAIINGNLRQVIEDNLPDGWAMTVRRTEVDGRYIDNHYE